MRMKCTKPVGTVEVPSPLGDITVKSCPDGVHEVCFSPVVNDENFHPNRSYTNSPTVEDKRPKSPGYQCAEWLRYYFEDPFSVSSRPLPNLCPLSDENFRARVWEKLFISVKVGETITYKDLAKRLNNPGAVRAVGSAMRNNPISIIVPCHRVVRKDGMGLYSGGTRQKVKEFLLRHEKVDLTKLK